MRLPRSSPRLAGHRGPGREVVGIGSRSALLVERFDRSEDGRPYGYLSFATILGQPATRYETQKTYADLVAAARAIGIRDPAPDVFRRLLVSAYLRNTDDHLRNHAVIDRGTGWGIAPAFDIVPQPGGRRHVCAPARGISPEWDPNLAFSAHVKLGLGEPVARDIREQVVDAVAAFGRHLEARDVSRRDRRLLAEIVHPAARPTA